MTIIVCTAKENDDALEGSGDRGQRTSTTTTNNRHTLRSMAANPGLSSSIRGFRLGKMRRLYHGNSALDIACQVLLAAAKKMSAYLIPLTTQSFYSSILDLVLKYNYLFPSKRMIINPIRSSKVFSESGPELEPGLHLHLLFSYPSVLSSVSPSFHSPCLSLSAFF